jgi:hypothetical protein
VPKKPRPAVPDEAQLVFPFPLRVGDVVLDENGPLEVVGRPSSLRGGKLVRAVVRNPAADVRQEMHWEAWRKVRVVRKPAA